MRHRTRIFSSLFLTALLLFGSIACGSDDETEPTESTEEEHDEVETNPRVEDEHLEQDDYDRSCTEDTDCHIVYEVTRSRSESGRTWCSYCYPMVLNDASHEDYQADQELLGCGGSDDGTCEQPLPEEAWCNGQNTCAILENEP